MSDKINFPYIFTDAEKKVISKNFTTYLDWDKAVFKHIKVNIIAHLRNEQNNKCCYCKNELGFDIKAVDIEHIISKSEYDIFTFYSKNLALSCPGCNTKKSTKPVVSKKYSSYPRNGNSFLIVHAHFDNYSNHIINKEECVYIAITAKGCDTIKYCELFRFLEVLERAKKFQTKKSSLAKLTEDIRNADYSEVNGLLELIKEKLKNN